MSRLYPIRYETADKDETIPDQVQTCGYCDKPCGNEWCVTKRKKEQSK